MATNAVIQTVGAAGYVSLRFVQNSHGFTGRVPVYYNTSTNLWTAARANAGSTLGTHIAKVIDSNNLLIVQSGVFSDTSHGLTPGQYYFVSDSSAGTLTVTEPTAVGSFSNPMVYVIDANSYVVLGYRSSQTINQSFNPLLNDGTAAAPSLAFNSDPDTGFYRIGANTIGIATNGVRIGEIGTSHGGFTGNVIQVVNSNYSTTGNTSSLIPVDGTIPQNTEGAEIATLTITPKYNNSKLLISASFLVTNSSANVFDTLALFQDSNANALSASVLGINGSNYGATLVLNYDMTSGTTSSTTFKLRYGPNAGTAYLGGNSGLLSFYGSTPFGNFRIIEVQQ